MKRTLEILERKLIRGDLVDGPALVPKPHTGDVSITGEKDASEGRAAAVLIPILKVSSGLNLFFTRRPETMKYHAGQISFPGGRRDQGDKTLIDTALREAHEEIGLDPNLVKIVGNLSPYQTITGFRIEPVIGLVEGAFTPTLDPREVVDAFQVSVGFFLDKANEQKHTTVYMGKERMFYAFQYEDRFIWGATAAMLINLREALLAYTELKG